MNYQSIARRYLPLAAVVAVQLLIIAVVPSKASVPSSTGVATGPVQGYSTGGGTAGAGGGGGPAAAAGTVGSSAVTSATGTGASATGGGVGGGSGATGAATPAAGGPAKPTGGAAAANDTTHCAGNREFSPSIDFYAPPCTPGAIGAAKVANGGATGPGVTPDTVTIVDYVTNYGAEVNTILQAQGLLETFQEAQVVDKAWQNFINAHYVLWGRQIHLVTYQGQCQSVPPDTNCLLPEMDSVVNTYHPYAVFWNTTLCSACFARLAADHVIGFGGDGFSDAFANANAPYFYSAFESSTHVEQAFAKWWCGQMTSNSSSRVVSFAPTKNPAQNFNGQKRVLGVIATNDPDNENTVQDVLIPALNSGCGDGGSIGTHHYYYSQDINTAAQQVEAGISAMDTTSNPATDVLCLCDPVAPEFLYQGEQQHNYWPENVLADVQGMGYDSAAQNYNQPPVSCPQPSLGCPFNDAFGILSQSPQEPQGNNAAIRTLKLGGATSIPITGLEATEIWMNYEMMASLIENAGPDLTAARMQAAAPSMGSIGGGTTGWYQVGFSAGNWNWTQDAEVAYWNKSAISSYNGAAGAFVPVEGRRFLPNQYPTLAEPPVPPNRA